MSVAPPAGIRHDDLDDVVGIIERLRRGKAARKGRDKQAERKQAGKRKRANNTNHGVLPPGAVFARTVAALRARGS